MGTVRNFPVPGDMDNRVVEVTRAAIARTTEILGESILRDSMEGNDLFTLAFGGDNYWHPVMVLAEWSRAADRSEDDEAICTRWTHSGGDALGVPYVDEYGFEFGFIVVEFSDGNSGVSIYSYVADTSDDPAIDGTRQPSHRDRLIHAARRMIFSLETR